MVVPGGRAAMWMGISAGMNVLACFDESEGNETTA
jgi:hypothetical protein